MFTPEKRLRKNSTFGLVWLGALHSPRPYPFHPSSPRRARRRALGVKLRTAIAACSLAALTMAAGSPGAEAEQIRIIHLNCKQWHARQALLAARAARPHPVTHHAIHRFRPRHGPRIHFVCDCVDGADVGELGGDSTDSLGGGALPVSSGAGGAGDFGQFFAAAGSPGGGFYAAGGSGSAGVNGGGSGGGYGIPSFLQGFSSSGGSSTPSGGLPTSPGGPSFSGGSLPSGDPSSPSDPSFSGDPSSPGDPSSSGDPSSPGGDPTSDQPSPFPPWQPDPGPLPAAPEPSTWVLFGLGAGALAGLKRRKRKAIAEPGF